MGNPDQCRPGFSAEALDLMKNLPLDGNIQCSGRFIGNDQIWFVQKRDRDRDSISRLCVRIRSQSVRVSG